MNRSITSILRGAAVTSVTALVLATPAGAGPIATTPVRVLQKASRAAIELNSYSKASTIIAFNSVIGGADSIAVYADSVHCVGEYFSIDQRFLAAGRSYGFMVSYSGDVSTDHIPGVLAPNGVITQSAADLLATKLVAWGAGGAATVSILDNKGLEVASRRVPVFVNGGAAPNESSGALRRFAACNPRLVARVE